MGLGRVLGDSLNTLHALVFLTRKMRNLFGAKCECNNNAVIEVNDSCLLIMKIDCILNCPNMPMVVVTFLPAFYPALVLSMHTLVHYILACS